MKEIRFTPDKGKRDDSTRDNVVVPINGEEYFAYRPSSNSIALFYASSGKKNLAIALAGVQDFLEKNLEPEAYGLLMRGVENDSLEFSDLLDLCQDLIREFSELPPTSPAASSSSRASTGRESTGNSRRPASTRATSRRPASAD